MILLLLLLLLQFSSHMGVYPSHCHTLFTLAAQFLLSLLRLRSDTLNSPELIWLVAPSSYTSTPSAAGSPYRFTTTWSLLAPWPSATGPLLGLGRSLTSSGMKQGGRLATAQDWHWKSTLSPSWWPDPDQKWSWCLIQQDRWSCWSWLYPWKTGWWSPSGGRGPRTWNWHVRPKQGVENQFQPPFYMACRGFTGQSPVRALKMLDVKEQLNRGAIKNISDTAGKASIWPWIIWGDLWTTNAI